MDIVDKFAKRVRDLRGERGSTAEGLASAAKLSTVMVNKIEQGAVSPSFQSQTMLAAALMVDPLYLFVFPGENPLHDLVELTRGASRSTVRAMLAACAEIAAKGALKSKTAKAVNE